MKKGSFFLIIIGSEKVVPASTFFPLKKEAAEADLLSNNRLLTRILVTSPFKILVHKVCCSKKGLFAHS